MDATGESSEVGTPGTIASESGGASRTLRSVSADLSESELERYRAQIERIGADAQLRLKAARAIVIGAGPAGAAAAAELVSRGVGYVAVADGARVTLGDLCGQALLYTPDVGTNRAEAVVAKLGVLNPHVHAESYPVDVDDANVEAILIGHDLVLDCAGGLPARAADVGTELVRADGNEAPDGLRVAARAVEVLSPERALR